MGYITDYQYYENGGLNPSQKNWGSYQYISLEDIINNFMLMYAGNHSLVNNEERYKVLFHAKRAIQELNYDAFKEIKILELSVCDTLRFVLPPDFVNWVRISQEIDGILYPLGENIQTNWSGAYLQDNECRILFDQDGNSLKPEFSDLDMSRMFGSSPTIYLNSNSPMNGKFGWNIDGTWYFQHNLEGRYGLNTETANANPTFSINKKGGVINFSSGVSGGLVVLEYVSDGMESGDDSLVSVNKMFEDYLYAYIEYAILGSKVGVQEYIVSRTRKRQSALLRNAKIRISNIHPGRLLQNLRGRDKWLK
jgi:hypothetical protein|tara:strand:- start:2512 stop:3435 length:924 start_codon:yes stop_codon:yes gene_type:complete